MIISAETYGALLRLVRYLMVGVLNTLASYGVFALFIWMGFHYTAATFAAFSVGMLMGFKLHGAFVFDHPGDHRFLRYTVISLVLFALSLGVQALVRTMANDYVAGAVACSISIPISFLLNRAFVFHAPDNLDQKG